MYMCGSSYIGDIVEPTQRMLPAYAIIFGLCTVLVGCEAGGGGDSVAVPGARTVVEDGSMITFLVNK